LGQDRCKVGEQSFRDGYLWVHFRNLQDFVYDICQGYHIIFLDLSLEGHFAEIIQNVRDGLGSSQLQPPFLIKFKHHLQHVQLLIKPYVFELIEDVVSLSHLLFELLRNRQSFHDIPYKLFNPCVVEQVEKNVKVFVEDVLNYAPLFFEEQLELTTCHWRFNHGLVEMLPG
jgi:hypothetical protein